MSMGSLFSCHSLLRITVILAAMINAGTAGADDRRPPNIVFIIADDLRFDLLGCNGHPHAWAPNIDRHPARLKTELRRLHLETDNPFGLFRDSDVPE